MLAAALSACGPSVAREDAFEQTGELIALGGGDAGVRGACVTCHGLQGEGDGHLVPRLAGLDQGYFARQMEFYSAGLRAHPQMSWIAARLDQPAREKLARYYAALPVPPASHAKTNASPSCAAVRLYHEGDPQRGLASCASCHGAKGEGAGLGNPPLAAQPAPYLADQLRRWKSGERTGDAQRVMTRISRALTDEERALVSDYNPGRPGARSYPELREACLRTRRPDPRSGA